MSSLSRIRRLLESETGLDAGTLGPCALDKSVSQRTTELPCGNQEAYWDLLNHDRSELDRLIDEIVVAESWFFRDGGPFEFLGEYVREHAREWIDHGPLPLRVLSAPCAQGEEPFSIAITLLESGLSPDSFEIDGVDLSHRLVRMAGSAPYRAVALRTVSETRRKRYFEPAENGQWFASDTLRRCVRFRRGNVTHPSFARNRTRYQIIFCRNLIIYLRPESRESLLAILHGLLQDDGVLIVGHAEAAPSLLAERFRPSDQPGAFAYYKVCQSSISGEEGSGRLSSTESGSKNATLLEKSSPSTDIGLPSRLSVTECAHDATRPASPPTQAEGTTGLAHAQKLANAGHLREAEQVCRDHLRGRADDSEAYYLLGTIQLAGGYKTPAEESFRKVVYLNRDHVEALWYLATLSESRGDERGARAWRRRLERLAASGQ